MENLTGAFDKELNIFLNQTSPPKNAVLKLKNFADPDVILIA